MLVLLVSLVLQCSVALAVCEKCWNFIISLIHELVSERLRDARSIQKILKARFPEESGRAFHPLLKDIRYHIAHASVQASPIDQIDTEKKLQRTL